MITIIGWAVLMSPINKSLITMYKIFPAKETGCLFFCNLLASSATVSSLSIANISKINNFCTKKISLGMINWLMMQSDEELPEEAITTSLPKKTRIQGQVLVQPRFKSQLISPVLLLTHNLPTRLSGPKIFIYCWASKAQTLVDHVLCVPLNGKKSKLGPVHDLLKQK